MFHAWAQKLYSFLLLLSVLKKKISDRAKDEGILQEALLIVVDLLKLTAT